MIMPQTWHSSLAWKATGSSDCRILLLAAAGRAEAQQQGEDGAGADAMQSVHGVLLDS